MAVVIIDAMYVEYVKTRHEMATFFGAHNQPCFGNSFYGRWVLHRAQLSFRQERRCIHYKMLDERCGGCWTLHQAHVHRGVGAPPVIMGHRAIV